MASTETTEDAPEVQPDELREGVVARLGDLLGDALVDSVIVPGADITARVTNESWKQSAEEIRYVLGARYFCFLSAIDWMPSPYGRYMDAEVDKVLAGTPTSGSLDGKTLEHGTCGGETRMQVFARFVNVRDHWGLTVKADVASDDDPRIETLTRVFAGADWHERETWEMFGISFNGHPGLRHLYLPQEFEGNPLRKDFPLVARVVKPWPGIVDTEPMPSSGDDESDEASAEGESA